MFDQEELLILKKLIEKERKANSKAMEKFKNKTGNRAYLRRVQTGFALMRINLRIIMKLD
jgi:hypothetical protein|tara:strand:- start:485 stop:664 length:180 start_codon:yes stop_codon:yes gene_type:complete